jgi:hypothetical protein
MRGTKAKGLKFERDIAKLLGPLAHHGQWFEFWDANGRGYCQPDIVFQTGGNIYILEVKLTNILEAMEQLYGLYIPVVSKALGQTARGIIVARHLIQVGDMNRVVDSLAGAVEKTQEVIPILHYIGKGPI